jgi:hypothetical protein
MHFAGQVSSIIRASSYDGRYETIQLSECRIVRHNSRHRMATRSHQKRLLITSSDTYSRSTMAPGMVAALHRRSAPRSGSITMDGNSRCLTSIAPKRVLVAASRLSMSCRVAAHRLVIRRPGVEPSYRDIPEPELSALLAEMEAIGDDPDGFQAFVTTAN